MSTFIFQECVIELTMPDSSTRQFLLEAPNGNNVFEWSIVPFKVQEDYRDGSPNRQLQKGYSLYVFEATLRYQWHRMFLTPLLVATNIKLKHPPGFEKVENYMETDCLLKNERAQKNYIQGLAVGATSTESEDDANPAPSGGVELTFEGREAMTWDKALDYYFYQRMDSSEVLASSDEETSNDDIVIHS